MSEQKQVAVRDAEVLPARRDPLEVLMAAIEKGADPETIKSLMDLQDRYEKNTARKAFDSAIAAAKADIGVIEKNKHVGFESKDKSKAPTDYYHEDLAGIAKVIDPILGRNGLSYRFRTRVAPNEPVTVTCIIAHRDGHFEENTLQAGADNTGNKNGIQAIGSTITYLQRYTLKAALGLAAGRDDDGAASEAEPPAPVTPVQITALQTRLRTVGYTEARVLKRFGVDKFEDLTAAQYKLANTELDELEAKRARDARVAQP